MTRCVRVREPAAERLCPEGDNERETDPYAARQEKKVEVSLEGLESGKDPLLPPLMNPTMLEASDDLTNLSHLNEPAGMLPLQDPSIPQ